MSLPLYGNHSRNLTDETNRRAWERIAVYRHELANGQATFEDFTHLKHQFPYFGLVPCRAEEIDFELFHAHDDVVAWEYLWFGADAYENEIVRQWIAWCREPDVELVYDIGAYSGHMSILAARAGLPIHVHLFEPMGRTIERAKMNVRVNRLAHRVNLHNKAAGNVAEDTWINLYREENFLGTGNSLVEKEGREVRDRKMITTVRIDDELPDLSPQVVKIDVEGHELECLRGMKETIARARPNILLEVWEENHEGVTAFLNDLDYDMRAFIESAERGTPSDDFSLPTNYACTPR